jgi:hypothetical protein
MLPVCVCGVLADPEDESLGDVMSPATCFLNHSCYPNAVVRVVQQGTPT